MFIACKAPSSVVPCSNMESSIGEASSSLLNLINARHFSALQQSKFGCFFKTLSASCNAFLLFPLSNQSKIHSVFREFHTHTTWTVRFADFFAVANSFSLPGCLVSTHLQYFAKYLDYIGHCCQPI